MAEATVEQGYAETFDYTTVREILYAADLRLPLFRFWKTTVWDDEAVAWALKILWYYERQLPHGNTGEIVAQRYTITREDADKFSLGSHQKAMRAIKSGAFKDEIVNVELPSKKEVVLFSQDEGPREDTTLEALAKLKPVFRNDGVLTAGNSSSINDGASAVVVMDGHYAKQMGLKPLVKIVDYVTTGIKPELLMEAPIHAVNKLLQRNQLEVKDLDLLEHNEAFSTASIAVMRSLNIPMVKFNVNGGADYSMG